MAMTSVRNRQQGRGAQRRASAAALVLAALLGAGGCASRAPAYQRPAAPLPAAYTVAYTADAQPLAPPDAQAASAALAWQDFFADPALRALVEQALANNRDLRAATLRVDEARAAYGIQRAERLPTLALAAQGARSRTPHDLNLTGRPLLGDEFRVGVGISNWELDFWGRVASLNDAALQNFLASDEQRRAATLAVAAQVAQAWLGLRELDQRLALARRTLASRETSLRLFRRRVEAGATSRLELTQVELLWRQASALLAQLEQSRAQQVHALTVLVGQPWAPAADAAAVLDDAALFRPLAPGVPSELLLNRPDIVAAEHALRAANANIGAARAAFFPRIALTASLPTASAELDGLFKSGSAAWSFVPTLQLPIFDGGRRQQSLALSEVRRDQAVVRYEQTIEAAFRDVADALAARRWLGEQVATLTATQALQAERARLAKLRYDSGAARYLEVLDAERELLSVEQQLVQNRSALLSAQVALYTALGGGSQALAAAGSAATAAAQDAAQAPTP